MEGDVTESIKDMNYHRTIMKKQQEFTVFIKVSIIMNYFIGEVNKMYIRE